MFYWNTCYHIKDQYMMFVEGVTQRVPNLPLSLRLKVSGCHYNSIYNNTWTKQAKQLSMHVNLQRHIQTWQVKQLCVLFHLVFFRFMLSNTTFSNISVISWLVVLMVEETGVLGENHRPVASCWQTLSHNFGM